MGYKQRRAWRHFKYWLLERFFSKPDLKKLIDLDQLDFQDATILTKLQVEMSMTDEEHDYFTDRSEFLKFVMAEKMVAKLTNHVELCHLYDLDDECHKWWGEVVLVRKK